MQRKLPSTAKKNISRPPKPPKSIADSKADKRRAASLVHATVALIKQPKFDIREASGIKSRDQPFPTGMCFRHYPANACAKTSHGTSLGGQLQNGVRRALRNAATQHETRSAAAASSRDFMTTQSEVFRINAAQNGAALNWWYETLLPNFLAAVERSRWPIGPSGTMEADIRSGAKSGQCIARQSFIVQRPTAVVQGAVELIAAKENQSPKVVLKVLSESGELVGPEEPFDCFPLQALDDVFDNA